MELCNEIMESPHRPTLTVVVTCHNYGHFLDACLASLDHQSCAPDQIIVVNDGSTDASASILAGHVDRIEVIHTENSGQAAAFNIGFARSKGDIVIFLDADDMLNPEAVESVIRLWCDDVAVMTFGLETIDEDGRSTGLYRASIHPDCGDIRPRLLSDGDLNVPPTSGNAFARKALERILPMPTERWRISADCYLIRAAGMVGRFEPIPHVLGSYRLHGHNSYVLTNDGADIPSHRPENLRYIAEALYELSVNAEKLADPGDDISVLAELLAARAEIRLAESVALRDVQRTRSRRPNVGRNLARVMGRDAAQKLLRQRWPMHVPFGGWIGLDAATFPSMDGLGTSRAVIAIDPSPRLITVEIMFRDASDDELTVSVDHEFAWHGRPGTEGVARFSLRAMPWARSRRLQIELASTCRLARLHAIKVSEHKDPEVPYFEGVRPESVWHTLASRLSTGQWVSGTGNSAMLVGRTGWLHFFRPEGDVARLSLHFGDLPPPGWLIVSYEDEKVFSGRTGSTTEIILPLYATSQVGNYVRLNFDFEPDTTSDRLELATLSLLVESPGQHGQTMPVLLNPGEQITFGSRRGRQLLDGGFLHSEDDEVHIVAAEARLRFALPVGAFDMAVEVFVQPQLEMVDGHAQLLAVSLDGEMLDAAAVVGAGKLRVSVPEQAAGREVLLVLHSALVALEVADMSPGQTAHAPLLILSLAFEARQLKPHIQTGQVTTLRSHLGRQLLDAATNLLREEDVVASEVSGLRDKLAAYLATCDARALLLVAANGDDLKTLADLGAVSRHLVATAHEAEAILQTAGERDVDRLRYLLIAILLKLPQEIESASALPDFPPPMFWHPESLALWLTEAPEMNSAATQQAYIGYLCRLLTSIDSVLAREPPTSAAFRLAAATLDTLRSTRAMFGEGVLRDFARIRARAIERVLARSGARLGMDRRPRLRRDRLRVVVFVRDVFANPEGWMLSGMYRHLDGDLFELVLVRMSHDPGALPIDDIFKQELCLAGMSVAASVAAIRALDADLLITGCFVTDYEKATAILAHRLAPLQIWPGAVCPASSGLTSFDLAISCMAAEPENPQRHYNEPLKLIKGTLQSAFAFPPLVSFDRKAVRDELGVATDATMLASGAMAHKISNLLLEAWASILAAAPQSVLVLYPFAKNWSMAFAEARFRQRIDRSLDFAGVSRERVILLQTQTPERARAIAGAADLYLDSFPYAGATTVCEALSVGTPVVTRGGDGLRLLTGAAWARTYGLNALCASTTDAYVEIASALARDPTRLAALRNEIAEKQRSKPPLYCDEVAFGRSYSQALWRAVSESGLFPWLADRERKPIKRRGPAEIAKPKLAAPPVARMGRAPVRVAILASPRTGSTLLCDIINSSRGALCHYEIFHRDMIQLRGNTIQDAPSLETRDRDPVAFLNRLVDDATQLGYQLVGFKHFSFLDSRVTASVIEDRNTHIVQLGRRNLLAQFSSERISKKTGIWFRGEGDPWQAPKIRFFSAAFERWMRYQRRTDGERMGQLAVAKRTALFIDYSNLLDADLPKRLSDFLGFAIDQNHVPNFRRQNDDDILGRFQNPDDVKAFLAKRGLLSWCRGG
ncbi:glycosyltransferase [Mesorhizobium yinganensis]|uniref:glycosyltransferase n=1 Tax=Mesorhizobium yinganensis TaxID=3157707 RepID=UPI0032B8444D